MQNTVQKANTRSLIDNVRLYFKIKQHHSAQKLLRMAIENGIDNADLRFWLGKTLHHQRQFTEALAEFNRALEHDPYHAETFIAMVATYCDIGKYEESHELYHKLMQAYEPTSRLHAFSLAHLRDCHRTIADLYADLGKSTEAIQEYQKALLCDHRDHDSRLCLAIRCYFPDKLERAQKELAIILAQEPEHYEALLWSGLCFYKQDNVDMASEQWERAYRLMPLDSKIKAFRQINA